MKDSIKHTLTSSQSAEQCHRDISAMIKEHGWVVVQLTAGGRSLSQNALYWTWLNDITVFINEKNKTDFKINEMHLRIKHDFLGYDKPKKVGSVEVKERLKSSTRLTTGEMYYFMSQIDAWAAGFGLLLSRPEDCQYEKLKIKQNQ